jgi:UDP-N-acetylglucosamine diphosphorylase/glucosamine-1-phosphate N-acetyltransferase
MGYILFDWFEAADLLPFTHTRAVADIRCGILTMRERWERIMGAGASILTRDYLQPVYGYEVLTGATFLNAAVVANSAIAAAVEGLGVDSVLVIGDTVIAAKISRSVAGLSDLHNALVACAKVPFEGEVVSIRNNWDIFSLNDAVLRSDFALLTYGRTSALLPSGVVVSGHDNLFIEHGANVYPGCIINATTGPVYIAKDAEVLEGTIMRGPIAVCEHAVIKMGAKVYGATTIGPGCKVGGELNNVVFFANSNKSHDGYLGNAVIGEWCNLGADTNCSNLKNDYGIVKVWNEATGREISTGLTFCGLMMGDHSKCGINTMFNTGTVVGVSCNIYGGGFPQKYVPSFSWGGSDGFVDFRLDKAIEAANRMMARRGKKLSDAEIEVWRGLYAGKKDI